MNKRCCTCEYESNDVHFEPCVECKKFIRNEIVYEKWEPKEDNQTAKADAGKLKLTLVPQQIIKDIAKIREYGNKKYGDPENWRTVEKDRYKNAAFRHWLAYLDNPQGVDEESGLSHLAHLACNIAFLCEMENDQ